MNQRPLHWSERAKMYQSPPTGGRGSSPQPQHHDQFQPAGKKPPHRGPSTGLWIALSVIVVVVAAASTVYFWYLPSRDSNNLEETMSSLMADDGSLNPAERRSADMEAQHLLHKAVAAMETGYSQVGSFDPAVLTPSLLVGIEPAISWTALADPATVTAVDLPDTCLAGENAVGYFGSETTCEVGTESRSGTTFAVAVDRAEGGGIYYLVSGVEQDWIVPSTFATTAPPQTDATWDHYENAELGCSFDYPGDWTDYSGTANSSDEALVYVGDSQDPQAQMTGMPTDFILLFGGRPPGATPASPRMHIEKLPDVREATDAGLVTIYEPVTEFELNGVSACSVSILVREDESVPAMVWTYVALTSGDRAFLLYLVSTLEELDENQPLFETVIQSFEVTASAP